MKKEIILKINNTDVKITNPEKIFWPSEGYAKKDLIDYYQKISKFILPYLIDRPESMNRHPDGIFGESFYQKNIDDQPPDWVKTIEIKSETENREINYLICNDERTLIYMANLGCIEINPWNSSVGKLDYPDFLILDIDPLDVPFSWVVQTANITHKILDKIGASNYCKTSGATGLHIYVPLGARYNYDQVREFGRLVEIVVNREIPEITSIERKPEKRQGKVYLDYLQNSRGQTLAAPYCVRPLPGASVSTPLNWKEVDENLDPKKYNMKNIFGRLDKIGDIWKGVLGKGIDMKKCLLKLEEMI